MHDAEFFQNIVKESIPNLMVTNFILVAEVISDEGTNLQVVLSQGTTPWLASGMLEFASDMLYTGEHEFTNLDEEEDY